MDYLRIVDWGHRQTFKDRRPPWIKFHADRLDQTTFLGAAYAALSRDAIALEPLLELLASRHDPPGLLPLNEGWIAYELRMLRLTPRQISKLISELMSVGLIERISVAETQTDISFPLARASAPLPLSDSLGSPGEGCGEGPESELPVHARVDAKLALAVEHYRLAARRGGWPGIRDSSLRRIEEKFLDVDARIRDEEAEFDWLICFGRGVEQPFIKTISSFGFEWFLRREFSGTRFNALKVWDFLFRDKQPPPRGGGRNSLGDFTAEA